MIETLETRIEAAIADPEMIAAMLRGVSAFPEYKSYLPFVGFGYTRTLLLKRPEFELVAMHWAPGSVSELHDHGTSRCWVAVIEGTLDVENFERRDAGEARADLAFMSSMRVAAGQTDHRLNWRELHLVRNTGSISCYSLQIYSPALTEYHVFDSATGLFTTANAYYDALFDL